MENRASIIAEYFRLRVMLNSANAVKNEQSELMFEIVRSGKNIILYVTLKGVKRPKNIELVAGLEYENGKLHTIQDFMN